MFHTFTPARLMAVVLQELLEVEQKNIRRRVYDALNVLVATGIASKDSNKVVTWNGMPTVRPTTAEDRRCKQLQVAIGTFSLSVNVRG